MSSDDSAAALDCSAQSSSNSIATSRAGARWGLLRAALLGVSAEPSDQEASIHRFAGLQMIPKRRLDDATGKRNVQSQLQSNEGSAEVLECLVLLLQCCCCLDDSNDQHDTIIRLPSSLVQHDPSLLTLRERLAKRGICCRPVQDSSGVLHCSFPPTNDYALFQYHIAPDTFVWTRERWCCSPLNHPRRAVRLQNLTSQQHHNGIDNTGNAFVWDSELTLAYCLVEAWNGGSGKNNALNEALIHVLLRPPNIDTSSLRVIELGAGMAAVAGLSLAALHARQRPFRPFHLNITDGHPDAVQHNQVNLLLNEIMWQSSSSRNAVSIHCQRLTWTSDMALQEDDDSYDICLASDCTHFQEFHASLMLTMARVLRIHGVAILCQPPRKRSLMNFMALVESMDGRLWDVTWWRDQYSPAVQAKHDEMMQRDNPDYDPDIHCPQIVVLRKLRSVTELDRQLALEHIANRT